MIKYDVDVYTEGRLDTLLKIIEFAEQHHHSCGITSWQMLLLRCLYPARGGDILIAKSEETNGPCIEKIRLNLYSDDLDEIKKSGLNYEIAREYVNTMEEDDK